MPLDRTIPVLEVGTIVEALRQHLGGTHDHARHCPRAAPSVGVVACTYHHWFKPFSQRRRYCQLPVSGRRMQRFLQFRLGSHQLPIILGRFAGGQHVARATRVCTYCGSVAVADELHMIFECPALQAVRWKYAPLFSTDTNTMRSFFAQPDHMQSVLFGWLWVNVFASMPEDVLHQDFNEYARDQQLRDMPVHTDSTLCTLEKLIHSFDFPKFHNTLQYVEDIQNFGMTDLTTTGPKERFNKDIKHAARKTNFKPGNTIAQVA
ncbi:TPA: hypothetical protein ACH3X1_001148 [Trebouxia sp. C0004]